MTQESSPAEMSLAQAARAIPSTKGDRPVASTTVSRWITAGVRLRTGKVVRLKAKRYPGGWKVTRQDIDEFLDALTASALGQKGWRPPTAGSAARKKALAKAAKECEALGR
jgi:hypothetical protein